MFNSTILDVGFGILFVFLAISLISGAVVEAIASAFKWRASMLLSGIKDMLNDQHFVALARDLYQHASINPRGTGIEENEPSYKIKPGYISKDQFANAFMDIIGISKVIANAGPTKPHFVPTDELKSAAEKKLDEASAKLKIAAVPVNAGPVRASASTAASSGPAALAEEPMKQTQELLHGIIERTLGDPTKIKTELESWFDNTMDRLSGAYKRRTQAVTFVIALIISVSLNIDTISITEAIWNQPSLVANLSKATDNSVSPEKALQYLQENLPVGWPAKFLIKKDASGKVQRENEHIQYGEFHFVPFVAAVVGWLITAIAALFGAPFWFDTLQKVTRLKGTAASPEEKEEKQGAAA